MFKKRKQIEIFSESDLRDLYVRTVAHARDPKFYTNFSVADTLPGRFSVVVLHLFLLMDKMGVGESSAQTLFDIFFYDMDRSMRENGVGDLAVPKRIKKAMKVFYEDIQLYQSQFSTAEDVKKTLKQTLYYGQDIEPVTLKKIAQYALKQKEMLDDTPLEALTSGFNFKL